ENGGNLEYLETYSLATGERIGRVASPGRIALAQYSADASRLLVTGADRLRLFDATSLADVPFEPSFASGSGPWNVSESSSIYASLGRSGRTLWLASDFNKGRPVLAIDLASGQVAGSWAPASDVMAMQPLGDGDRLALLTFGYEYAPILERNGAMKSIPAPGASGPGGFATSADGTRLAVARAHGFIVYDVASNEWLTPPIDFAIDRNEGVVGMSFDESGSELRARTSARHWLRQAFASDPRPVAELQAIAASLSPAPGEMERSYAPA